MLVSLGRSLCRLSRAVRRCGAPRRSLNTFPEELRPRLYAHFDRVIKEFDDVSARIVSSSSAGADVSLEDTKRWHSLKSVVDKINDLTLMRGLRDDTQKMIDTLCDEDERDEDELVAMAETENRDRERAISQLELDIVKLLLPPKLLSDCAVLLEVKIGVGGLESMLFASEVFQMYLNYAGFRGWSYAVVEEAQADLGGLRSGAVEIWNGADIYEDLKHETGVHRVQRVPVTGDVIHTSTVTVFVMPKPAEIEAFELDPDDIDQQVHHSSGKGGQSVNKHLSAVRLVHKPTGLRVDCQVHRTQHQNRIEGLRQLREKVLRQKLEQLANDERQARCVQDQRDRSDRIRTYNYQQGRVTDHRLRRSQSNLQNFMSDGQQLHQFVQTFREREFLAEVERLLRQGEDAVRAAS